METRAILRHARISPRKVRLVVDLVRGKDVDDALRTLEFTTKGAARVVAKTLRSAVANAENTQNVDVDRLFVKKIYVDNAPIAYRWRPRAQGRATPIRKRGSHITIVVDEREDG